MGEDGGAIPQRDGRPVLCTEETVDPAFRGGWDDGEADAEVILQWAQVALSHGGVVGAPDFWRMGGEESIDEHLFFKSPSKDAVTAGLDGGEDGGVGKFAEHPVGGGVVVDRNLPAAGHMLAVGNEGVDFAIGNHPPRGGGPGGEEDPSGRLQRASAG